MQTLIEQNLLAWLHQELQTIISDLVNYWFVQLMNITACASAFREMGSKILFRPHSQ